MNLKSLGVRMGTFMAANKTVIVKSTTPDLVVELDVATTFSFHIYERNQGTPLTAIDYRLIKVSGRDTSVIQTWTSVSLVADDGIFIFDVTVTGVTAADTLSIEFKIIDTDGLETFQSLGNIRVVV